MRALIAAALGLTVFGAVSLSLVCRSSLGSGTISQYRTSQVGLCPSGMSCLYNATTQVSAATVGLLPVNCTEPAWLSRHPVTPPWNLTIMHTRVLNNAGNITYDTGCADGWAGCGHKGVGPSIRRGLTSLGVKFHWQPTHDDRVADVVYMHAGDMHTLRQALAWKAAGKVKVVVTGPNVVGGDLSCAGDSAMQDPLLNAYVVPSFWVALLMDVQCPWLWGRIRTLANGVDEQYWKPSVPREQRKKALLYLKSGDAALHNSLESVVRAAGYDTIRIRYGSYTRDQKKAALGQSRFMVLVTQTESQGIAAAEAWAMDVPTLVWSTFGWQPPDNPSFSLVSSPCPYLTPATGAFFSSASELSFLLTHWHAWEQVHIAPREWLLRHLTDALAVKNLLRVLDCEWQKQKQTTKL